MQRREEATPDEFDQGHVQLSGPATQPVHHLAGTCLLAALAAVATSTPQLLPHVALLFQLLALPWRVTRFTKRGWVFFLADFCYAANLAFMLFFFTLAWLQSTAGIHLCGKPGAHAWLCACSATNDMHTTKVGSNTISSDPVRTETKDTSDFLAKQQPSSDPTCLVQGVAAALYILTEGPLAGALLVWQCAWVLDSLDHTVSVMIHLLPGMAMSAYRFHWLHTPGVVADAYVSSALTPTPSHSNASSLQGSHTLSSVLWNTIGTSSATLTPGAAFALPHPTRLAMVWWLGGAPLLFYIGWQLYYFIMVQVVFRPLIRARRYDTSYSYLARRAKRGNSRLNSLVRSGSIARRITVYGCLQLVFTIVTGAWAIATYYSYPLALLWQAIKWIVPLYHGACHHARTTHLPKARLRPAVVTVVASSNCPPPKADFESSYKKRE